jgi:hypothetical protein
LFRRLAGMLLLPSLRLIQGGSGYLRSASSLQDKLFSSN